MFILLCLFIHCFLKEENVQDNILWKKSAKEMLSLLIDKSVSPAEALNSIMERIKETHKDINAVVTLCEERAQESIKNINTDCS